MASTSSSSDRFTASEWTQQTMLSDLMHQKWLIVGAGACIGLLWLMSRRSRPEQKAARRLVRDWRRVEDPEDVRDLIGENIPTIMRPALLSAVEEIERQVHRAFRQLERDIERL